MAKQIDQMKKISVFIVFFFIATYGYSDDIHFKVIRKTPYWTDINFPRDSNSPRGSNIAGYIEEDTMLKHSGGMSQIIQLFNQTNGHREFRFMQYVYYEKEKGRKITIFSEDIIPAETTELFDELFIRGMNECWIQDKWLKALSANNRNLVREMHPELWNDFDKWHYNAYEYEGYFGREWWEQDFPFYMNYGQLYLTQTGLYFVIIPSFWRTFFIKNITKINDYRYTITVINDWNEEEPNYDNMPWFSLPKGLFDFTLILDGDFFSIYLSKNNMHIATFVRVDETILAEVNNLFQTNIFNPGNIKFWPRRADGSMDYPSPFVDMSGYTATHRTIDNLRVRDTASTAAKLVTTLPKGTEVQAIETGTVSTIDGINAPWVRIISSTGYTGWCFSGYLEEIKRPEYYVENDIVDITGDGGSHAEELIQNDTTEPQSIPLWAWFAIIGGVILVVGGIVVLIMVKRKKQQ